MIYIILFIALVVYLGWVYLRFVERPRRKKAAQQRLLYEIEERKEQKKRDAAYRANQRKAEQQRRDQFEALKKSMSQSGLDPERLNLLLRQLEQQNLIQHQSHMFSTMMSAASTAAYSSPFLSSNQLISLAQRYNGSLSGFNR